MLIYANEADLSSLKNRETSSWGKPLDIATKNTSMGDFVEKLIMLIYVNLCNLGCLVVFKM